MVPLLLGPRSPAANGLVQRKNPGSASALPEKISGLCSLRRIKKI